MFHYDWAHTQERTLFTVYNRYAAVQTDAANKRCAQILLPTFISPILGEDLQATWVDKEKKESDKFGDLLKDSKVEYNVDMRHIQYQGETLPHFPTSPFPLVLAFHLVLGKFHI